MKKKLYMLSICAITLCTSQLHADFWDDIAKDFEKFGKELAKGWKEVSEAFKDFGQMAGAGFDVLPDTVKLGNDISDAVKNIQDKLLPQFKSDKNVAEKIKTVGSIIDAIIKPNLDQVATIVNDVNTAYIKPYHADTGKNVEDVVNGIKSGTELLDTFINKALPDIAQSVQEIIDMINEIEQATKQAEESS